MRLRNLLLVLVTASCVAAAGDQTLQAQSSSSGVLLIGLGVHVEPFGLVNGRIQNTSNSYANEAYFRRHAALLRSLARTVERHGGRATIQVQSPFIDSAARYDNVIGELDAAGHEIALHFHEDPHLGRNSEALPVERWIAAFDGQIAKIKALDVDRVRMWSGGNLYPHVLEAADAAGLDVMSDWKNPRTQTADARLQVTVPWRPAGSPNGGDDLTAFVRDDPAGKIVYLPTGAIEPKAMRADEIDAAADPSQALKAYWTEGLSASLSSAATNPRATHVFHITLHPGELQMNRYGGDTTLDEWLAEQVDPLLLAGKVRWATYSQMADAFRAGAPASTTATSAMASSAGSSIASTSSAAAHWRDVVTGNGFITFAVNVHDWKHPDESADTVLRAIDLFQRHGVKGDFYLTSQVAEFYARSRPEVIDRLRATGMGISYHVRAPHPLYAGFDDELESLTDAEIESRLREYETWQLDLTTGGIVRGRPGGYSYVRDLLGTPPVTIGAPSDSARVRAAAERVYRSLGAGAVVVYHETGTRPDAPFEWRNGLLVRPSDFSVTRWSVDGRPENFWWNMLGSRYAVEYDPATYLANRVSTWTHDRAPLVTALIHENNFVRSGAEGWTLSFYADTSKTTPLAPPFDLNAPDPSTLRPVADQARIWAAYERLVQWSAANLRVVTSMDLLQMANQTR